eukprot:g867.t1
MCCVRSSRSWRSWRRRRRHGSALRVARARAATARRSRRDRTRALRLMRTPARVPSHKVGGRCFAQAGRRAYKKGESTDKQVFNPKQHIPPGWDHWVAQVGKVSYFNYELNRNGQVEEHGDEGDADYLPTLMREEAIRKINNWAKRGDPRPMFMQLSFTSPHDPIEPEPKHTNKFLDMQAPRYPSFNFGPKDRLAWISASTPLMQHQISYVDLHYIKRLQMLMSVDQAVRDIGRALNDGE